MRNVENKFMLEEGVAEKRDECLTICGFLIDYNLNLIERSETFQDLYLI